MFRKDRILGTKKKGGGVLLYIKNTINAIVREDYLDQNFPECIWCEIEICKEKTLIGVCYRPPDYGKIQDEALFKMIGRVSKEQLLLMGDFNFPELNWKLPETLDDSHLFMKCVNDNFLVQCVEDCTREKNILDLVLTSEENMVENLTVGEPFSTSDHQIIRWDFTACKGAQSKKGVAEKNYDYFKADYDKMRDDYKGMNWSRSVYNGSIELAWNDFRNSMETLRDKWVPEKRSKNVKSKWVNKIVIRCRRAKEKSWCKYQMQKTEENYEEYKIELRTAVASCRMAKRTFEQKLANDVKITVRVFLHT
jgi:hypothetical protein